MGCIVRHFWNGIAHVNQYREEGKQYIIKFISKIDGDNRIIQMKMIENPIVQQKNIQTFKNPQNSDKFPMGFPIDAPTQALASKYQGIIIAEISCTLILYLIVKITHFCMWGSSQLQKNKQERSGENEEDAHSRKWDQESWDLYFPIIYAYHVIALALPLVYSPCIFSCVIGFIHFGLFFAMMIVNIFIGDDEPGHTRTKVSRILWGVMCLINIVLVITGLVGIRHVLVAPI